MAAYNKVYLTLDYLIRGQMIFASTGTADTFKAALMNVAPSASNSSWGGLASSEISAVNGYTAGGATITMSSSNTTGTESIYWSAANPTWTGSTANSSAGFGAFRYVVLWDTTSCGTVAWFDYGSAITVNAGDTFTLTSTANGVLFTAV